ncbi:hypothetical protein [Klebsiella aerogenes]|uniref:hypothetical protein n=1 Tax=Klebsiella aerogenes TaxID=548 RepID=UPI0037B5C8A7
MTNTQYSVPFESMFDPDRAQEFIIRAILRGDLHTAELVEVLAVQPVSDRVGFVTVQPLVLQSDTNNIVIAQSPAYNVPYLRLQGGVSAVILDPVVGDRGVALYAQNDITNVKTTLAEGQAATDRVFSTADGLYLGGFLNAAPTQWVKFLGAGAGIDIHSPGSIALTAGTTLTLTAGTTMQFNAPGGLTINANTTLNGTFNSTATAGGSVTFASPIQAPDVVLPAGGVNTHTHGGVQTGTGTTRPMNT